MNGNEKGTRRKERVCTPAFHAGGNTKGYRGKVGVSAVTINKWVAENGWQEQRAASNITRPELVNKLLHTIDKLIEQVNESDDPEAMAGLGDKLAKLSTTIERLDKKASIVDVIEVFMAFSKWMQFRMSFDDGITPELLKTINKYHDLYISELLQNKFNQ